MIDRLFEVIAVGLKSLRRNALRTFLTMLGMIFGVGAVIAMLAVGAGAEHEILSRIQELGVRNIIVNSVKPPLDSEPDENSEQQYMMRYGLTFEDAEYLKTICSSVERILPVNVTRKRVWYGSRRVETSVQGVEPDHLRMFGLDVRRGRTFNELDDAAAQRVCLIRPTLLRQLEILDDPIGLQLLIGKEPFEVVGLLADESFRSHTRKALAIDDATQEIYIPYGTAMRTFGTVTRIYRSGSEENYNVDLDQIVVVAEAPDKVFETARMIRSILDNTHKKRDYELVVPLELLRQSEETQRVFNIVMILIASISLVVGGIGIANIMLATITERTKEIGIRRAIGARRIDIMLQFLTETTAISVLGGLLGCAFGAAVVYGIVELTQWTALVEPHYALISLAISGAVGVVSGIYPARRAAAMDPILALRYE